MAHANVGSRGLLAQTCAFNFISPGVLNPHRDFFHSLGSFGEKSTSLFLPKFSHLQVRLEDKSMLRSVYSKGKCHLLDVQASRYHVEFFEIDYWQGDRAGPSLFETSLQSGKFKSL